MQNYIVSIERYFHPSKWQVKFLSRPDKRRLKKGRRLRHRLDDQSLKVSCGDYFIRLLLRHDPRHIGHRSFTLVGRYRNSHEHHMTMATRARITVYVNGRCNKTRDNSPWKLYTGFSTVYPQQASARSSRELEMLNITLGSSIIVSNLLDHAYSIDFRQKKKEKKGGSQSSRWKSVSLYAIMYWGVYNSILVYLNIFYALYKQWQTCVVTINIRYILKSVAFSISSAENLHYEEEKDTCPLIINPTQKAFLIPRLLCSTMYACVHAMKNNRKKMRFSLRNLSYPMLY